MEMEAQLQQNNPREVWRNMNRISGHLNSNGGATASSDRGWNRNRICFSTDSIHPHSFHQPPLLTLPPPSLLARHSSLNPPHPRPHKAYERLYDKLDTGERRKKEKKICKDWEDRELELRRMFSRWGWARKVLEMWGKCAKEMKGVLGGVWNLEENERQCTNEEPEKIRNWVNQIRNNEEKPRRGWKVERQLVPMTYQDMYGSA